MDTLYNNSLLLWTPCIMHEREGIVTWTVLTVTHTVTWHNESYLSRLTAYKPLHAIIEYISSQYSSQARKLKILYAETLKMSLVIRQHDMYVCLLMHCKCRPALRVLFERLVLHLVQNLRFLKRFQGWYESNKLQP